MRLLYFISCFLLLSSTPPRSISDGERTFPTISELDKTVGRSDEYEKQRLSGLDSLRTLEKRGSDAETMYNVYSGICAIYDRYQTDSALI